MLVKKITKSELILKTPAKINLFLEVLNKRPDGFHNIYSLFQAVSLYDILRIKLTKKPGISLICMNNKNLSVGSDNLIVKAYNLLNQKYEFQYGLEIALEKNIPIAGGLGGGSSDSAATILACNLLYNIGLSYPEMSTLSEEIGSDLPFFFSSGQALVSGRGEVINESKFITDFELILVSPNLSIETAESYASLKRGLTKQKNPFNLRRCRTLNDYVDQLRSAGNDFEKVQFLNYPELGEIKDELNQNGALLAQMSGSGPTMFGVFIDFNKVNLDKFSKGRDWRIYTVSPISLTRHLQL
jgi:4-diphosphocytidyl-2-C-methyl-D-erythritol kinase